MRVQIKKLNEAATAPAYAHPGDAGLDLFAATDAVITAGQQAQIGTGYAMAIPSGYVGLIWDKSGLAAKHCLTCLGGVIDSGYRGEIQVIVRNLGVSDYQVRAGDKIAQMLIQPVVSGQLTEAETLDDTIRGEGGFGSTGK